MKSAFIETLSELAARDRHLMLLSGDLGFKVFDIFRGKYPGQFLNMGVAESHMISVAAGLALEGKRPVVYSIAPFLIMRPYEQIRNDICFHQASVILVGAGGGFSYGANGASHHALTDVALMRALPEMNVFTPADDYETKWCVETAYSQKNPAYIRLGRNVAPSIHSQVLRGKDIERGVLLNDGDEIGILVSGFILPNAYQAARELMKRGYSVRLISFPLIKPLSEDLVEETFEQCSWVFTVEEHHLIGGFSGAVMEVAMAKRLPLEKLCPIAAQETAIYETGSHDYLRRKAGLSSESIVCRIENFIKEKAYAH